ncbi:MAG: biotin transporter BioY [Peptostreptococcaceae bacterium]
MKSKDLVLCSLFASITVICAQISLPIGSVPFTLQVFSVMLVSLLFDKNKSFISILVYVLIGAIGLPVFANLTGGFGILFGPTGGYILSLPICAYVVSSLNEKFSKNNFQTFLIMVFGLLIVYLFGTSQFMLITKNDLLTSLSLCVLPFVIFDLIKIIMAIYISKIISKKLKYL